MNDIDPALTGDAGNAFVVLSKDTIPVAFDKAEEAALDADTPIKDSAGKEIKVKTSFCLMKEGVMEHTIDEYAKLAGVEKSQIEKAVKEFTSYGTRAAVTQYHGAGNYISGTYASYPVAVLNAMVGNVDRKGGYMIGGGGAAAWNTGMYDLKEFAGKRKLQGPIITREKFATPHAPTLKFAGVRTPTIEPLTGTTSDGRPFSEETFLIDVAKAAGLPGFGDNAIKGKDGKMYPLNKAEGYYLRAIANVATGAKVSQASQEEIDFVERNYPVAKHKDMLPESEWKQVCYVLARGGVFDKSYEDVFDGEKHKLPLLLIDFSCILKNP